MLPALRLLLLLPLLLRGSQAQGNPCPLYANSTAARSCGPTLCFASNFVSRGVLQRAPARAAYYGATGEPPVAGAVVTLTLAGALDGGAAYNKTFSTTSLADGTWKVLLDAMPTHGNFSATVACAACGSGPRAVTLTEQSFGIVWVMAGQSNMGTGSSVDHNFWRNASYAGVAAGNYSNILYLSTGDGGGVATPREELGNWITSDFDGRRLSPAVQLGELDGYAAVPLFYAMKLTDLFLERGARPPPLAVYSVAVGGTDLAAWTPYAALAAASPANATCMCADNWTEECPWQLPIANRTQCQCNGMLYARKIQPLLNMTIEGLIFWQGENDCHFEAGNSALNTGYGATLPVMVAAYRAAWSAVPGTTPPSMPFGNVLLSDGSEFGTPGAFAAITLAQTANFMSLPNAAIPGTAFLVTAHDIGDPYMDLNNPDLCSRAQCCVEPWVPLGANCSGDHRGQWTNSTPNNGSLHPRTKDLAAARLAQAAYATLYEPASELLAGGPVLAGCSLSADGGTLTLRFDGARLKGEAVLVAKPAGAAPLSLAAENSALYLLVNGSLPAAAAAGHTVAPYRGPFSTGADAQSGGVLVPGNEFGAAPWVAALPRAGAAAHTVDVDLAPLRGEAPTAVRYALGAGGGGDFLPGRQQGPWGDQGARLCCGPAVDTGRQPCPPEACPIKASGRLQLPALPFVAEIVGGKCRCLPPASCDA